VAASGPLLTFGTDAQTAVSLDISQPLTPVTQNTFNALQRVLRLSADQALIGRAEDDAGLALLSNSTDVDQDGMLDAWEQQLISLSAATNGPLRAIWDVLPGDDFDQDGMSNYAEYRAGTLPGDPQSRFAAYLPAPPSGDAITLRWTSVAGQTYTIHRSTNITTGFSAVTNVLASGPITEATLPTSGPGAFYLIEIEPAQ
jgi:hypothetical protein